MSSFNSGHDRQSRELLGCLAAIVVSLGCSKKGGDTSMAVVKPAAAPAAVTYRPLCPEDGRWNECITLDKLVHAGVAPALDSADTTHVNFLSPPGINYHIGRTAKLVLFYYSDSVQAKKAWDSVDTLRLVGKNDPVTADSLLPWGQRPASFRAANVIGAFMSYKPEQIERVLAAFAAGLPAPTPRADTKP